MSLCILDHSRREFSEKSIKYILKNSDKCIDNNKYNSILPIKLYEHQKEIYKIFKDQQEPEACILYCTNIVWEDSYTCWTIRAIQNYIHVCFKTYRSTTCQESYKPT